MLITNRHFKGTERRLGLDEGALVRRDFWESKEEAWTSLSTKGMKAWDKRVVKLFVVSRTGSDLYLILYRRPLTSISLQEFGLRETTKDDPFDRPGVTLKCARVQESVTLKDKTSTVLAFDFLDTLCSNSPVHVIWGAIDDYM